MNLQYKLCTLFLQYMSLCKFFADIQVTVSGNFNSNIVSKLIGTNLKTKEIECDEMDREQIILLYFLICTRIYYLKLLSEQLDIEYDCKWLTLRKFEI